MIPRLSTGYEPKAFRAMESRSSRRIPSRGREAPAPTADEQLDQLIEEARAERRAKAREGQGASSSGGELVLSGLSPEQQGWLVRAANTFRAGGEVPRPEFLPPPLAVEPPPGIRGAESSLLGPLGVPITYGPMGFGGAWNVVEGQRHGQGDLRDLGRGGRGQRDAPRHLAGVPEGPGRALRDGERGGEGPGRALRDGERGGDGPGRALRDGERGGDPRGGQGGAEGERRVHSVGSVVANLFPEPTSRQTSGQRMTPGGRIPHSPSPVPTVVAGPEVNPFWSESLRKEMGSAAMVQDGNERSQACEERGTLTRQDVVDLEEMKRKGEQELEKRIREEVARRSAAGSGSYQSVVTAREIEGRQLATPGGVAGVTGEGLSESLRSLELPKLTMETSSIGFGDWLTIIEPLMADISGSSAVWWRMVITAAEHAYRLYGFKQTL